MSDTKSTDQADREAANPGSGSKTAAYIMFGLLLLTYTLMSADRYLISMLGPDIRKALTTSLPGAAALTTMFTLGLGIAGLPAGALIARTSRKFVLITGVALFSCATLYFTKATTFQSMFISIVLQGVGMAFLATSMFSLSSSYFSANRVAAVGLVNVCFGLGSFVGPWAIGDLRQMTGNWHTPVLVFGFLGIGLAVLIALFVRPWFSETKVAAKHAADTGGAKSLNNHNTILLAVMSALYGLIIYGFLGPFPTFLRDSQGFSPAEAGIIMKYFGVGALTSFFGGKLGDKFSSKSVLIVASAALAVLGFLIYQPDMGSTYYKVLAMLVGLFGASIVYTNLAGAHIKALSRSLSSKGSSMFVSSIYAGASLGGWTMGKLVESGGWGFAGNIQMSLLAVLICVLALLLKEDQFSK